MLSRSPLSIFAEYISREEACRRSQYWRHSAARIIIGPAQRVHSTTYNDPAPGTVGQQAACLPGLSAYCRTTRPSADAMARCARHGMYFHETRCVAFSFGTRLNYDGEEQLAHISDTISVTIGDSVTTLLAFKFTPKIS